MFDLKLIKAIKCSDVARNNGIQLVKKGNRLWGSLRHGDKSSSFAISENKNLWCDFGDGNKGGSVIDLVMEIEGIAKDEAIRKLAEDYNIDSEKVTPNKWRPLTDSQYNEIDIFPQKATLNFGYDLNIHTPQQLQKWNDKYSMHVKDLAEKYPVAYNKMVTSIAMKNINVLRDAYFTRLKMFQDPTTDILTKKLLKDISIGDVEELNRKIDLLKRALTTTNVDYNTLKVNIEKDFKDITPQPKENLVKIQKKHQEIKELTQDEIIRERMVSVYKKLFNYNLAEYLTVKQAVALNDINKVISNNENKVLPIASIRKAYVLLGENLDKLEKQYNQVMKEGKNIPIDLSNLEYKAWQLKSEEIKSNLLKVKDLFSKSSMVIEGIREAGMTIKSEAAKQSVADNPIKKNMDYTQ